MKINKQKLHLKQSQVVRRGSSHTLPLELSCRPSRKKVVTFHPSGERKNFFLPGNSPTNERLPYSANEKSLHSELPVSSNGLSVYNSPAQSPLLYKKAFLLFVLRLSCHSVIVDCICELQCFAVPKETHSAGKITGCFVLGQHSFS